MKIAVFGAGGVGGYFGGRLAQSGAQVVFIARGAQLRALQSGGLQVDSIKGDFSLPHVQAVAHPQEAGPVDGVILAVKAWQIPEAARQLRKALGPDSWVLPLSNGVEAAGQLAAELGEQRVLGGLCRISSFLAQPGKIVHAAIEPSIALGELDSRPSPRLDSLRRLLEQAGLQVETPTDIHRAIWEKFVFIAPLSGVGAVTRLPVGAFRQVPQSRHLLEAALGETAAVGRALAVDLPAGLEAATLAYIDRLPSHTVPSMQRDIQDGRPSELEAQTGAVVRLGKEAGVETPVSAFLYAALLPQELSARGQLEKI
jgi:2-dehydropantoate 2-reductase